MRRQYLLFYNVKSSEDGLIGLVTAPMLFSNKNSELHIFINTDIKIPTSFPAELTIIQSAIKKIEIYETNQKAIALAFLAFAAFVVVLVKSSGGLNIGIGIPNF